MNYTLQQLKAFQCVAKHQSITKASEELNLTQPAVSIQIKRFQDQFDIPLTEIIGRKLYLTDFGQQVLAVAKEILVNNEKIHQLTNNYKGLLTGKIDISVVSTGKYVIPYFLSDFLQKYPHVDISIDVNNRNIVLGRLKNNETDFALVSVLPDDIPLTRLELMPNKLELVTLPEHFKNFKKKNIKEYIEQSTIILREYGSATKQLMESYFEKQKIKPKKIMYLVSNEAVKQAVLAGLGISILSLNGLKNELENDSLKIIRYNGLPIKTSWNIVHLKNKELSPAANKLLEMIQLDLDKTIKNKFSWINKY